MIARRTFLLLGMASIAAVWIPDVGRGYVTQAQPPRGLGIGVNLAMPEPERDAALALALGVLRPAWWHHWRQWPVSGHSGFVPSIVPHPNNGSTHTMTPELLAGFTSAMAVVDGDMITRCWIVGNEPEYSGWTPEQTAAAIAAQVGVLRDAGLVPVVIAPGCNVTQTAHLEYLDAWRNAASRYGLAYTLAVHIYGHRLDTLALAWERFTATLDTDEQVIVTECGAGPNRPMADWLAVMPWFYGLLNSPQVAALAPFAAFSATMPEGGYPGMMTATGTLTALGEQWTDTRR